MNIKCPNCGAVHSLDTLINDAEASAVLKAVLEMDAELGKAAYGISVCSALPIPALLGAYRETAE